MELFNSQKKAIDKAVDSIFYRLSARLLGRFFKGPKIFFQVISDTNPLNTLEAVFHYTMNMTAGPTKFDSRNPKKLAEITSNYIEAERLKTKNRIQMAISGAEDIEEVEEVVSEEIGKATKYVDLLLDTEIRQHQSFAEKVGIEKVSASLGIEDPVVCKFGIIDDKLCLEENELISTMKGPKKAKDILVGEILKDNTFIKRKKLIDQNKVLYKKESKRECISLLFDNGNKIVCTKDHPLLIKGKGIENKNIYTFIEADNINESHEVVFLDELTKKERDAVAFYIKPRGFMIGCIDSWDYWKTHRYLIGRDLKIMTLKRVKEKYGLLTKEWDRYVKPILRLYEIEVNTKKGYNNNNKEYILKMYRENEARYQQLGGDKWFIDQIVNKERNCKDLSVSYNLIKRSLQRKVGKLGLMSSVRARGGRSTWKKHRDFFVNAMIKRTLNCTSYGHFSKSSKPEKEVLCRLTSIGHTAQGQVKIERITVDILLEEESIIIEYDGSGHSREKFKSNILVSTNQRDYSRDKFLISKGYRVFRIKSSKDIVPTESELKDKLAEFIKSERKFDKWVVS